MLEEGGLQRVKFLALRQAFDGGDLAALGKGSERQA